MFKDRNHFLNVKGTPEYQRILEEYMDHTGIARQDAVAVGSEFNELYGAAFYGERGSRRGQPINWRSTERSREAFLDLMAATGKIEEGSDMDDWNRIYEDTP